MLNTYQMWNQVFPHSFKIVFTCEYLLSLWRMCFLFKKPVKTHWKRKLSRWHLCRNYTTVFLHQISSVFGMVPIRILGTLVKFGEPARVSASFEQSGSNHGYAINRIFKHLLRFPLEVEENLLFLGSCWGQTFGVLNLFC